VAWIGSQVTLSNSPPVLLQFRTAGAEVGNRARHCSQATAADRHDLSRGNRISCGRRDRRSSSSSSVEVTLNTVHSRDVSRVQTKLFDADSSGSGNVPCACVADTNRHVSYSYRYKWFRPTELWAFDVHIVHSSSKSIFETWKWWPQILCHLAIRGFFLNDMRYINSRFTYLLTYLVTYSNARQFFQFLWLNFLNI